MGRNHVDCNEYIQLRSTHRPGVGIQIAVRITTNEAYITLISMLYLHNDYCGKIVISHWRGHGRNRERHAILIKHIWISYTNIQSACAPTNANYLLLHRFGVSNLDVLWKFMGAVQNGCRWWTHSSNDRMLKTVWKFGKSGFFFTFICLIRLTAEFMRSPHKQPLVET